MLTKAERASREATLAAAADAAPILADTAEQAGLYPLRLLKAFALVESNLGAAIDENGMVSSRYEPAYGPGGRYFRSHVKTAWSKWGSIVASSCGPWQVMWATAIRYGYPVDADPSGLRLPSENAPVAARIITAKLSSILGFRTETTNPYWHDTPLLTLLADSYNSGNARDRIIPHTYIEKLAAAYDRLTEKETYP